MEFQEEYKKLNKEQKRAVDAIEGPVMVVAGPGTGKTQILTLRIANILRQTQADPGNILALTFTESGVASMRKRLSEMIGSEAYRVNITTFHSFASSIISDYPEYFPHIISSSAVSDVEQVTMIQDLVLDTKLEILKPFGDNFHYVFHIMQAIKSLKREGIEPKEFEALVREEREQFENIEDLYYEKGAHKGKMRGKYVNTSKQINKNEELVIIYDAYQKKLEEKKLFDFEDMIVETLRALKLHQDLLSSLQEKYQYVLVDEHQDTNNAQNKILELLLNFHQNPNIFVVGDEKQAIFRFQGASLENFYYFRHLYPKAELINLSENYRSTQRILDSADSLLEEGKGLKASARDDDHPIKVSGLENELSEMKYVSGEVGKLVGSGVTPSEIAVLYRNNKDAYDLIPFLEKNKVPYVIESDTSIFDEVIVKKTLILLEAIWNIGDDEKLAKALHLDLFDITALDAFKLIKSVSSKRKKLLADIIRSEKELKDLNLEKLDEVMDTGEKISAWSKDVRNGELVSVLGNIIHDSGIVSRAISEGIETALSSIEILFEEVKKVAIRKKEATLGDFLEHVKTIKDHNIMLKKRSSVVEKGKVRLMTVHRSKGLEFEHVFIIHADDRHFGKKNKDKLPLIPRVYKLINGIEVDPSDDERNLFYVALTRAKKGIEITYSKQTTEGRELLPTMFIQDLKEELLERVEPDVKLDKGESIPNFKVSKGPAISKEFVRSVFEKQGLSVTALNNYLKSPWQYFYQNLIRIPQIPSKHQSYGSAVHGALHEMFEKLKREENVTEKELLGIFNRNLDDQWFIEHEREEARKKGEKALSLWFKEYSSSWITNTMNEYRVNDVVLSEGIRLVGFLDKIEFLGPEEVNVVDYKTGKPRTRNNILGKTKDSDGGYYRQLVFYKLLLDLHAKGKYQFTSGEIDFIEPDSRDNLHKEKFVIPDEDVLDLKEQILQVSDEIVNLKFLDTECDPDSCDYCDLVDLIS